jgi:ribA/ribD-fused uncharacterized protein
MRVTDKHIFFWGEWPSNWYKCYFKVKQDDKEYDFFNSEQYFMWMKAITFGDETTALRILMEGKNPKMAKTLGRLVKNYDDKKWNEIRYQIMVNANYYKYSQSEELKELLLNPEFDDKHFVEASPLDGIWGIKCGETEALDDKSNWNGLNLLGKALDEVREKLKGNTV